MSDLHISLTGGTFNYFTKLVKAVEKIASKLEESQNITSTNKLSVPCPHKEEYITFDRDGGSFCNACDTMLS